MSKHLWQLIAALVLAPGLALGQSANRPAGDFDYYVMALTWAPTWCTLEGDDRDAPQCDPSADAGFTLHGLWPQYESGWPANCRTSERDPSRQETGRMADLFGSSGSAWHQWKKHGRCAGMPSEDYFALAREAYATVTRPSVLRRITEPLDVPPDVIEQAFLEENPSLPANAITPICRNGMIFEMRICMTQSLDFRACGANIGTQCSSNFTKILPVR